MTLQSLYAETRLIANHYLDKIAIEERPDNLIMHRWEFSRLMKLFKKASDEIIRLESSLEKQWIFKTTIDSEFEIDADIILNKDKIQQGHKPDLY